MKKAGHLLFFTCFLLLLSSCSRQYTYYQLMPRRAAGSFTAIKNDNTVPMKKISGSLVASNKQGISEEENAPVLKNFSGIPATALITKKKKTSATYSFQATTAAVLHPTGKEAIPAAGESTVWSQRTYLFLWIICLIGAIWLSAFQLYPLSFVLWIGFIIFFVIWCIKWAGSR